MAVPESRGSRAGVHRLSWALLLCTTLACAGLRSERHLAPLVTTLSLAGGDRETEALGGIFLRQTGATTGQTDYWAMRPVFSSRTA